MPRETIGTPTPADTFEVKVGWNRDMDVQIGVEVTDGRSMFWTLLGSEPMMADLGKAIRWANTPTEMTLEEWLANVATPPGEEDARMGKRLLDALDVSTPWYQGIWANLDRKGCNDLIRILRRARDAAFGRDE